MPHPTTEAAKAQVRKHLKVRPVPIQHLQARLTISLRLVGDGNRDLIKPVLDTVSLARPLDPAVREINLSQVHSSMAAAVATLARSYDQLLQPEASGLKTGAPVARSVVTPTHRQEPPLAVTEMLNQTRTKIKTEEDSLQGKGDQD